MRLEEFDRGRIVPHEKTFPAAKEDRLRLLTALQINTSSIFGLYSGAHPELDRLREQVAAREPLIDLVDDLGIRNELRPIEAAEEIAIIQRELESPRILIADGHHRYETALNYRRARRHENASSEPRAVRLHDDDAGRMRRSRAGDSADASGGEIAAAPMRSRRSTQRAREVFDVEEIAHRDEFRARLNDSGTGAIGVALKGESATI